jgi:anti-anti-sigma factor
MKLSTSFDPSGVAEVTVEGEVDAYTASDLDGALSGALGRANRLLLDFTRVSYLSSAGLRVLLRAEREARKLGGGLCLYGLGAHVHRVLEVAGLDRVLRIAPDRAQALEAL